MLGSGGSSKKIIQDAIATALAAQEKWFSYKTVVSGSTLTIPQYQQMVVVGEQIVDGTQIIDGDLAIIGGEEVATNSFTADKFDAFGRLRVSQATPQFEGQLTYNLQPLLFEQITNGSGATITHSSTNRNAVLAFSSTPSGGKAIMQTYEWFHYKPSMSQVIYLTFNFGAHTANVEKFAGYSDGNNGFELFSDGTELGVRIFSETGVGDQTIMQSAWNLDKLDGNGDSGFQLDVSKHQILLIDFQALYAGRVRFGIAQDGSNLYFHEFDNANAQIYPYVQTANLPLRVGMISTGTVTDSMQFTCCSVASEAGTAPLLGFGFSAEGTVTAGSGARTHILSIRPKTTFNSIANRVKFTLSDIEILVTGNYPVKWELVLGQAISGATTYSDVNTTYSAFEYNTAGTISGSPTLVIDSGYVAATNRAAGAANIEHATRYPITLDAAGAVRALGTLSLIVTGVGGASACRATFNWREVR